MSGITLTRDGAVATLLLDRPDAGNAIDMATARALAAAARSVAEDHAIRCVVLTGAGRMFSVGGDLGEFSRQTAVPSVYMAELADTLHLAIRTLIHMAKPLLVLVNGPAAGAGMSLALAGDLVLAARSAHFTTAYGAIGLTPDGGMSWLLPRLVGLRRAQDLLFTSRRVGAEEAVQIGLVTNCVADAELASAGAALAARLAASAISALADTRRLLLEANADDLDAHLRNEATQIARAVTRGEAGEGIAAFVNRRTANFSAVK